MTDEIEEKNPTVIETSVINTERNVSTRMENAVVSIANSFTAISNFLTGPNGLQALIATQTRANIVGGILEGLATKDGRNSLDPRVMKQNALEITEIVENVLKKYADTLKEKQGADPELKDAEKIAGFHKWQPPSGDSNPD